MAAAAAAALGEGKAPTDRTAATCPHERFYHWLG